MKAAHWLDERFQPTDYEISLNDTFPVLIGPHYPDYLIQWLQTNTFADVASAIGKPSVDNVLKATEEITGGHRTWIVFSDSQEHSALVAGAFTRAQVDQLEATVAARSTLAYDSDGVRIYEVPAS